MSKRTKGYWGLDNPPREVKAAPARGFLYHATLSSRIPSIMSEGLTPSRAPTLRVPGMDIPETATRIYFTREREDVEVFAESLLSSSSSHGSVAILRVRIPVGVTLYRESPSTDPVPSVYAKQRIPPQYVEVVEIW